MDVKIETITPEIAREMLARNPANRRLSKGRAAIIARDMAEGRWQVNGDAIRLNCDGSLIDGQHRLTACVDAGVPFTTLVVRGLPAEVRTTIDGGAKRSAADRFTIAGVPYATRVAASVTGLYTIAHRNRHAAPSPAELEAILDAHPRIVNSARACDKAFPSLNARLATIHYIGSHLGFSAQADDFIAVWRSGVPAYDGDPAHICREKVIRLRGTAQTPTGHILARMVVHSWNLFRQGKSVRSLKLPEEFGVPGWDVRRLFGRD